MARSSRRSWPILVPMLAILAAACGGTTPVTSGSPGTTTPAATPATPSVATDDASAPPSGTLTGDPIAVDTSGGDYRIPAAEQENAVRAGGRLQATMTDALGPDAAILAAALDQQASDQLWAVVDDATTAGVSSGPTTILASVRLPRSEARAASVPPPGMALLGPWITALMLVDQRLGQAAYTDTSHKAESVALGANKGTVTTDTTVSATPSGSRLVVDVVIRTKGEASDADGRLIFRIDGNGHARIEIEACPDPGGVAPVNLEFSASELYFVSGGGNRIGLSWQDENKGDGQIFANDAADIDHLVLSMATEHAVKGGTKAAGAGQSTLTDASISTNTPPVSIDAAGHSSDVETTYVGHGTTMRAINEQLRDAGAFISGSMWIAAGSARKFWQSGKCVEVVVDPNGGDVGAGSTTKVTAKVRQRFENAELDKPVEATMTGVKSIEPAGSKVPSPASFTYTAGAQPEDAGIVTFKSVSNRGIGETTSTFTVGGKELDVTIDGRSTTSALGVSYRTTVKVSKLRLARQPDGSYQGSAPATTSIQLLATSHAHRRSRRRGR